MMEINERRHKTRQKEGHLLDDVVPDLPDMTQIEVIDAIIDTTEEPVTEKDVQEAVNEVNNVSVCEPIANGKFVTTDISRIYPSITHFNEAEDSLMDSLELIAQRMRAVEAQAPIEEWRLPDPLPDEQIRQYYHNELLKILPTLETQFLRRMDDVLHPLAELVDAYGRALQQEAAVKQQLSAAEDDTERIRSALWTATDRTAVRQAKCRCNAVVKATYQWVEATFSTDEARRLESMVGQCAGDLLDGAVLAAYQTAFNKALVDDYLTRVRNGGNSDPHCLTVLFQFVRRPPIDPRLTDALRDWVAFMARPIADGGSPSDKLYLLWEFMHAPAGVGSWGASLVQIDSADLALASLKMLLAGQTQREALLRGWAVKTGEQHDWAVVDSDGEEEESLDNCWYQLRDSDLNALLGQIPLRTLFAAGLGVSADVETAYEPSLYCRLPTILRLMAWCKEFVSTVEQGMHYHASSRYRSFGKRLSRLIKHAVQFMTDHLEAVLAASMLPPNQYVLTDSDRWLMLAQYEDVFNQSLTALLAHRGHGNWQVLVDLPWRLLSTRCKEASFIRLVDHQQTSVTIGQPLPSSVGDILRPLQSTIQSVPQSDAIYLLTALANLAMECRQDVYTEARLQFVVTDSLFQLGYVVPATRQLLSKVVRELLSSLCLRHPQLLSVIIDAGRLWHPSIGQMGMFLFRELPFCLLVPTNDEMRQFADWLIDNPPSSIPNQLARHILANINWGFSDAAETRLYVPLRLHQQTAMLLTTAFRKHVVEGGKTAGQSLIYDGMKLIMNLWWNQEAVQEQSFIAWALSLISRLRLHPSSRIRVTDSYLLEPASSVLSSTEWIQAMSDAQQDRCNNPVAMYVCVASRQNTNTSVISEGAAIGIISNLVGGRHQQYRLAMELLCTFISTSSSQLDGLARDEGVRALWRQLAHADDTYYGAIKATIATRQFPGPVLARLGGSFCCGMILAANTDKYQEEAIIRLFVRLAFAAGGDSGWPSDGSLSWLLDRLAEYSVAMRMQDLLADEVRLFVRQNADKQLQDASKRSGLAQLLRIGGAFTTVISQMAQGNWWARAAVLGAQVRWEDDSGLWRTFVGKLLVRKKKNRRNVGEERTVSTAMTSTCKHLRWGISMSVNSLAIVQGAQLISQCPPDCLGIVWAAAVFFPRYLGLARVWDGTLVDHGSAGHRIFLDDGCHGYLLAARASIAAARAHYGSLVDEIPQTDINRRQSMELLRDMLDTFLLWIDEPKLHMREIVVSALPYQYRPDLLDRLRCGIISPEELGMPHRTLLEEMRKTADEWQTRHDVDKRFVRLVDALMRKPIVSISSRLFQRFQRQHSVLILPDTPHSLYNTPSIPASALTNQSELREFAKNPMVTVSQCALRYRGSKNFLDDLNKRLMTAVGHLYEQQTVATTTTVPCGKGQQMCSGPASIPLNYSTWVLQNHVTTDITRNRIDFKQQLDDVLSFSCLDQLVKAVVTLEHLLMALTNGLNNQQLQSPPSSSAVTISQQGAIICGLELFFYIGSQVADDTDRYPPQREMIRRIMDGLGSTFLSVAAGQAGRLLEGMLQNDRLVELYSPHFCPTNGDTADVPSMYNHACDGLRMGRCSASNAVIILSKFDMQQFINNGPHPSHRVAMIDAICTGITHVKIDLDKASHLDSSIEQMHTENLVTVISSNLAACLPALLFRFRNDCANNLLASRFWSIPVRCIHQSTSSLGELPMSIDEIRTELDAFGQWLNGCRFGGDDNNQRYGLFIKYGYHTKGMADVYNGLIESFWFKCCRSAAEGHVAWEQVVGSGWDLFLKFYIPWLQAFHNPDDPSSMLKVNLPWRCEDQSFVDVIVKLSIDQLNHFLTRISGEEARAYLMHCILLWLCNGLLSVKDLPTKPYQETYCSMASDLNWECLRPNKECVSLLIECYSRMWLFEPAKVTLIKIASQVHWRSLPFINESVFVCQLFDLLVAVVCKTTSLFKTVATEALIDRLTDFDWTILPAVSYRQGMTCMLAAMEPRIILCTPSTVEGKLVRLLSVCAGNASTLDDDSSIAAIDKHTIYVGTVVRMLTISFSFASGASRSSKGGSGRSSTGDDGSHMKMLQMRISVLFCELETVVEQMENADVARTLAMAMIDEVLCLFRNPTIAVVALEPAIGWVQESRESPLVLPMLTALYRHPVNVSSMVQLAQELLGAYILSDNSDGTYTSWVTITTIARLEPSLHQQYWKEAIKQSCMLCLVQQVILAYPSAKVSSTGDSQWQQRIVDCLDACRSHGDIVERAIIILVFLFLRLFLPGAISSGGRSTSPFRDIVQLLLKTSESKKSSGLLGKVGLGKRSQYSFEFRLVCRCIAVFLHAQLPTNNLLRLRPDCDGGITGPDMTITTRPPGTPLPTNKTLQNMEWLKQMRQSKELTVSTREALEEAIMFICKPQHNLVDSVTLLRTVTRRLWPDDKLLRLIYCDNDGV